MKFKPRFRDDNVKFKAKFATSDSVIKPLDVTENGDYTVPNGVDGFNPIKVNVPLPDGFIKPEGTINITQDGEWDVRNFEKANVNASGSAQTEMAGMIERTITKISNNKATKVEMSAFENFTSLVSVNLPEVTTVQTNAFKYCTSLKNLNLPKVTYFNSDALYGCSALETINFPELQLTESGCFSGCSGITKVSIPKTTVIAQKVFNGCSSLKSIDLPSATGISTSAFENCYLLEKADFIGGSSLGSRTFYNCYSLKALIIRKTSLVKLSSTNALSNCYHFIGQTQAIYNPNGDKDGYIYVPKNLVENYKVATNWSAFASQFRAIEDYPEICG